MASINNIFNPRSEEDGDFFYGVKKILGFSPKNISLFVEAFTHRSMNEKNRKDKPLNYERMEFLGDAILSTVIASHLYKKVPGGNEGYLTKMRSKVVSREHLNELGRDLNLIKLVKPRKAILTNLHTDLDYNFLKKKLPSNILPAYDGLSFNF